MPEAQKFNEWAKGKILYERVEQSNLTRDILSEWDENTRYNERMAQDLVLVRSLVSSFPNDMKESFLNLVSDIRTYYRGLDGYAIDKAILAETAIQQKEKESKKGFLQNIFGGE